MKSAEDTVRFKKEDNRNIGGMDVNSSKMPPEREAVVLT